MLDDVELISSKENVAMFEKQKFLIERFEQNNNSNIILQIALLQTLVPIVDYKNAIIILKSYIVDNYDYLIIGAYLNSMCLDFGDNEFLDKLLSMKKKYNNRQVAIINYLHALHINNRSNNLSEIINLTTESINLCDELVSNYYLRAIITNSYSDKEHAKSNVEKILSKEDLKKLTLDDLINPTLFIKEKIEMTLMNVESYNAIFDDI